jgi:hypothetical protein
MNAKNSLINQKKRMASSLFQKYASLTLEDKTLIGIGVLFLIIIFGFIYIANTVFTSLHQTVPLEVISHHSNEIEEDFKKTFRECEEEFQKLGEAFEENRRRRDEAFQQAVGNFQDRFKNAQEKFDKSPSPAQKMKFSK